VNVAKVFKLIIMMLHHADSSFVHRFSLYQSSVIILPLSESNSEPGFDYQAVGSYYGKLHAVIRQSNDLHHFIFNDTAKVWDFQSVDAQSAKLPTLTEYNGEQCLMGTKSFFPLGVPKATHGLPTSL
jgi:hypothetical protein